MRCEHLHDSAVYVLGALSPPERETYERHLADCAQCRAEVAEFGELPTLLGKLDPDVAQALAADDVPPGWAGPSAAPATASWAGPSAVPSEASWAGPSAVSAASAASPADPLLPRVLDRAQRSRRTDRRRRRWQSVGTALVAACLGVLAVIGVRSAGVGQPDFVAMQEVAATVPVTASLALENEPGGTVVRMQCAYKPVAAAGHGKWTYKLYVVPKTGEPEELDSWTAGVGDEYDLKAHSRIQRGDIQKIEIRKGDGTPLLVLNA
ncbi:zf-HC2 domain-containing protein [Dactylosporangium sp. NPDC049525]|uniref:anti-sigma factor family protein n=1 Tax=Dactylosporangium sp. NPDC049525 TaxID=3154730 RepID=UPI0034381BAC